MAGLILRPTAGIRSTPAEIRSSMAETSSLTDAHGAEHADRAAQAARACIANALLLRPCTGELAASPFSPSPSPAPAPAPGLTSVREPRRSHLSPTPISPSPGELAATAHAARLLESAPAEWRMAPSAWSCAPRAPLPSSRHRERLHRYEVPPTITLLDLLHARIGEGFRLLPHPGRPCVPPFAAACSPTFPPVSPAFL